MDKIKPYFPILTWAPAYQKDYIVRDLIAGFTVALTVVPQVRDQAVNLQIFARTDIVQTNRKHHSHDFPWNFIQLSGSCLCITSPFAYRVWAVHIVPLCHYLHFSRQFKGFGRRTTITNVPTDRWVLYATTELAATWRSKELGNSLFFGSAFGVYIMSTWTSDSICPSD